MTTKTIIIDPRAKTIEVTSIERAGWREIAAAIGCQSVTRLCLLRPEWARNGLGLDLWLDDEGLLACGQAHFAIAGYRCPLAGRAVLLAIDLGGESHGLDERVDTGETLALLGKHVRFIGDDEALEAEIRAGGIERPEVAVISEGVRTVTARWAPWRGMVDVN